MKNLFKQLTVLLISITVCSCITAPDNADEEIKVESGTQVKAKEEINKQVQIRNLFIVGFLFMTILGIVIYLGYLRKKRNNKTLEKQRKQIEVMSKKVHEADQMKLRFFTNISHELRTPLTLISGLADKLLYSLKDNNPAKIIKKNTVKLIHLVNQLLDLRKLDAGKMKLRITKGNITNFIKGITASFENYAKQKNIALEYRTINEDVIGYFDSEKLEKIMSNLVSNAIKYTKSTGSVSVKVLTDKKNQSYINIIVKDTGIGIPKNQHNMIFERFYQLSNGSNNGSGIGLALTKELIEQHKGNITIDSEVGKGSIFRLRLPIPQATSSG